MHIKPVNSSDPKTNGQDTNSRTTGPRANIFRSIIQWLKQSSTILWKYK